MEKNWKDCSPRPTFKPDRREISSGLVAKPLCRHRFLTQLLLLLVDIRDTYLHFSLQQLVQLGQVGLIMMVTTTMLLIEAGANQLLAARAHISSRQKFASKTLSRHFPPRDGSFRSEAFLCRQVYLSTLKHNSISGRVE